MLPSATATANDHYFYTVNCTVAASHATVPNLDDDSCGPNTLYIQFCTNSTEVSRECCSHV